VGGARQGAPGELMTRAALTAQDRERRVLAERQPVRRDDPSGRL
jgi:hypothetical protein